MSALPPAVADQELQAQRGYARRVHDSGFDFSLTIADAFVRGIRDIGYRHTGTALDELIDNALQASATNVHIIFGYGDRSAAKPDRIAVLDDGHGMHPEMLRLAVTWGGTHREAPIPERRIGFGRYGYGLPSASVSQGRRFTVYSLIEEGRWHRIRLDLDDIGRGRYTEPSTARIVVPEPVAATTRPYWITAYLDQHAEQLGGETTHGTIVVLEKLDRLSWATTAALQRRLLEHFGTTYRNFLRAARIVVNGSPVEPIDPLFLTPGLHHYDLDEDRAIPLDPIRIRIRDRSGRQDLGLMQVRLARLPATFARVHKDYPRSKNNARLGIMKEHNGIIFLREGRQVDVVTKLPWFGIQNNDRYWKVEVDFPAALDEEFGVTTSKQQVVPSERIWTVLEEAGVKQTILRMRQDYAREAREASGHPNEGDGGLPSGAVGRRPPNQARNIEREAEQARGLPDGKQLSEPGYQPERDGPKPGPDLRPRYRVLCEDAPGTPFFRVERREKLSVLRINTSHPFYADVYARSESTPRLRAALELLLLVIGEHRLEMVGVWSDRSDEELQAWSIRLASVLGQLEPDNFDPILPGAADPEPRSPGA